MKRLVTLIVLIFVTACSDQPAEYKETRYVFGTLVEFIIRGADEDLAKHAITEVDRDFQRMHKDWHAWKPGGELYDINRAMDQGETVEVSDFVLPLLLQGQQYEVMSGGLFNPAIGKLIDAWGFHADELPTGSLPDFDQIKRLASRQASMLDIMVEGNQVSTINRTVSFDFGGFGKGVALDMAVEKLKSLGIQNAIVNAGGDLNTIGKPGERLWTVGIRDPRDWGVIASVELTGGENLYTSGNYERFRMSEGVKYAHIIDPRTGMPVEHTASASVVHENGALADAAATALVVAGPQEWEKVVESMGLKYAMIVDTEGRVFITPAMKDRVTFETDKKLDILEGR
ncbi:FAD:protein FMN transferase [Magnetovibrio sp. PR-2]|uniref:FAD:protein FMN transferase n=1 Tax=Magnetovibrio sp. PR-2 TaxID=3120356 RepID=UPI002FCE33CB